ncbi:unnamed protein product [Peronospora belbahrii]|uniref:TLC domain-containing protein n=1 Tax=Peronospora belbahrii TaxID=622444 RepID=A0AAU9L532_9STRA|nr:unnamed protein product [Peronospora belbahrii]
MPCYLTACDPLTEVKRFVLALLGLYVFHYVVDTVLIRPMVQYMLHKGWLTLEKKDKMRESLYKNAAVGVFHVFGFYIGWNETWFFNKEEYFKDFPQVVSEALHWYYMIYLCYWIQSADFMLNLTNKHYTIKRKDNAEMFVHHFATISLMLFSYYVDLTRIGLCVLMMHDVNDLLLETAKVFVYLQWETAANVFFGLFALVWFVVRWFFFSYNILHSVYANAYRDIVVPITKAGSYHGIDAQMVVKALNDGSVEKDIRSESEGEEEEEQPKKLLEASETSNPRRRRAPKAD